MWATPYLAELTLGLLSFGQGSGWEKFTDGENVVLTHFLTNQKCYYRMTRLCLTQSAIGGAPAEGGERERK